MIPTDSFGSQCWLIDHIDYSHTSYKIDFNNEKIITQSFDQFQIIIDWPWMGWFWVIKHNEIIGQIRLC